MCNDHRAPLSVGAFNEAKRCRGCAGDEITLSQVRVMREHASSPDQRSEEVGMESSERQSSEGLPLAFARSERW